jgi:murein DD-endopeptidase MepM/ murein hydrolase activator NlpD
MRSKFHLPARFVLFTCVFAGALFAVAVFAVGLFAVAVAHQNDGARKGYDITRTGLTPRYPQNMSCSRLTSLYASWDDVDGTRRDKPHPGVDGGKLGDAILAPASGHVAALWRANWGWGEEQALLLKYTAQELNLDAHSDLVYYSEFDHLNLHETIPLSANDKVTRGERLATVFRPGGNPDYLPETHWEVWEANAAAPLTWHKNNFDGLYWLIQSARLIDPLYMLSLNGVVHDDLNVDITPYQESVDYSNFVGFTYILPCRPAPLSERILPGAVH